MLAMGEEMGLTHSQEPGRKFNLFLCGEAVRSQQGRFQVALQPILNGGDHCSINCDANIVSYFYEPYCD